MFSGTRLPTFQRCLLSPSSGRPNDGGLVYETNADTIPALLRRISAAAQSTINHAETIAEAAQSLLLRSENCVV
jgi:hypothetical protein